MNEPVEIIECDPPTYKNFHDLTGRRFERLTVLKFFGKRTYSPQSKLHYWICRCDCGTEKLIASANLRSGDTKSCGCLYAEIISTISTTHGLSYAPEYFSWHGLVDRCTNPKCKAWEYYGGRGIRVCERWKTIANFIADMGKRPSPLHTVERIDNDGDYEPNNCVWATKAVQNRNKSTTRFLEFNGRKMCIAEWETTLGFKKTTVNARLKRGWSTERALTEPV